MPQQANNHVQRTSRQELASLSKEQLEALSKEQLEAIFLDQKERLPRRMQAFEQLRVLHTLMPQPPPRSEYASSFRIALTPPRFLTPRLPSPLKTVLSRIDPRQKSPPREHSHQRSKSPHTALVGDLVSKSPDFESNDVSECCCLFVLFQ